MVADRVVLKIRLQHSAVCEYCGEWSLDIKGFSDRQGEMLTRAYAAVYEHLKSRLHRENKWAAAAGQVIKEARAAASEGQ